MTTLDLTPLLNVLLPIVAAIVGTSMPIITALIFKRFGIANDSDMAKKVDAALQDGGGMLYEYCTRHEGGLANVDVRNAGTAAVLQHITNQVGPELTALGYTPDHVANMLKGELGQLLAGDPSVTAGAPPQVPAVKMLPAAVPVTVVGEPKP
jgi:hypothetical protein